MLKSTVCSIVYLASLFLTNLLAISTSTTEIQGKHSPKPKIDIVVSKSDIFDKVKQEKDLLVCLELDYSENQDAERR